jgi:uncharacterized membrane protein
MSRLGQYIQRWQEKPKVRPWALAGPVIILLICLPLLRPLRHPALISDDEQARLASIRALAERHTLAISPVENAIPLADTVSADHKFYSDQPPLFSVLLAGPYWIMRRCGISFRENPALVSYLLTLIGVTIPVAGAAGLLYRMGRLFELPRIWRSALGLAVVLGSGLISYAVVLNSIAPAAVLLLAAAGCIIQVSRATKGTRSGGWLALSGFCAAMAAALEPTAVILAVLLGISIVAIRASWWRRTAGLLLYLTGAALPVAVHAALILPINNQLLPHSFMRELNGSTAQNIDQQIEDEAERSAAASIGRIVSRLYTGLIGSHGLFSHFPILIFGLAGVGAVMHRNWMPSTKLLAAGSATGMGAIVGLYCYSQADWRVAMFAARWWIVFSPLLLFWIGAWARREHARGGWGIAAALLCFSAMVGLIGATGPCPPGGFDRYTVAGALKNLVRGDVNNLQPPALASKR